MVKTITVVHTITFEEEQNTSSFRGQVDISMAERAARRFMVDLLEGHLGTIYKVESAEGAWYDGRRATYPLPEVDLLEAQVTSKKVPDPFVLYDSEES